MITNSYRAQSFLFCPLLTEQVYCSPPNTFMSLFTIRDHTVTDSQGSERNCKLRRCELEEALNRMKIMYWIKNTIRVFRKAEDISARKFSPIIYPSCIPHTSRKAGCKHTASGPPFHNIPNALFNVEWQCYSK